MHTVHVIRLGPSAMERWASIGSHRQEIRCPEPRRKIPTRPCVQIVKHHYDHRYQRREAGQKIVRRGINDRVQGLQKTLQSRLAKSDWKDRQPRSQNGYRQRKRGILHVSWQAQIKHHRWRTGAGGGEIFISNRF